LVDCHATHRLPFPAAAVLVQSVWTVAFALHLVSQKFARSVQASALEPDDDELLTVPDELELEDEEDDDEPLLHASPPGDASPWLHV
jgi:hypothetical protein